MLWNKTLIACLFIVLSSFYAPGKKRLTVVFVGDSITYGAGLKTGDKGTPPAVAGHFLEDHHIADSIKVINEGRSGFTTVDYLPATKGAFYKVVEAANKAQEEFESDLIFSLMLGTNDSAEEGPNGSPVSPEAYYTNIKLIVDSLLANFPKSKIVLQYATWYSKTTYNGSRYLEAGLNRLQSYSPQIRQLVKQYAHTNPGRVFAGDHAPFKYFKHHYKRLFQAENGKQGIFYLHPNAEGAAVLGNYWGASISRVINATSHPANP